MKVEVTQVQQSLADVSATRALDNLGNGFPDAERFAVAFRAHLSDAKALSALIANPRLEKSLAAAEKEFEPYYQHGVKMAKAYVSHGTAGGNPMMAKFEALAAHLREALSDIAAIAVEITHSSTKRTNASIDDLETSNNRQLSIVLVLSAVAVALTAVLALLMHASVGNPIRQLSESMDVLADGEMHRSIPLTETQNEVGDMARAVEVFRCDAIERLRLTSEARLLSQFNDWLQLAKSEKELYQMIADVLETLIQGSAGSLYIYANSRDVLDCVTTWSGEGNTHNMHPDECWGLRRGRTYTRLAGCDGINFACEHVHSAADNTCCVPILAHGETVGLLHLQSKEGRSTAEFGEDCRLGVACAEQISLAIANIKLREQLRDQSIRDPLTGLYNRRYMLDTCRREFARARREGHEVGILSLDVDHFKKYNDNHGHDAGDAVLRMVGECLRSTFRDEDVPCRFGGEEFVVVLPGCDLEVSAARAEELRKKVEALTVRYADSQLPRISISVGVSTFPMFGQSPTEVLKAADEAMYLAKTNGRNCVVVSEMSKINANTLLNPSEAADELAA